MRPKSLRAFSLVEVIISLLIMSIMGAAVVGSLWWVSSVFSQTEDYTAAYQEIESVFQVVGGQITNAGLGMPNNKGEGGSFAESFRSPGSPPIMSLLGNKEEAWGGPVTIAN
ncbi:MAG: type II secretion system GspH family protein, partial [Synergistaceae bacterium]|nr:type II secretion system GspH family protein [Synergistaceae bacterium]